MRSISPCVVVDAVRTPIGKYGGALASCRPDDLVASAIESLLQRNPTLDRSTIEDVFLGNANGAGEENRNVGRMAALLAGAVGVPGTTVNRLCGSGLEAVIQGSRAVEVGDVVTCIAGGVESMTRAPWVLPKPDSGYPRQSTVAHSTTLGWRMVNPRMKSEWTVALGEGAEILADRFGITREQQDEFALRSQMQAASAWSEGLFGDEVVAVPGCDLSVDESVRPSVTLERLRALKPVFRDGGTVTAGNSSSLNDGAAALLMMTEEGASRLGVEPLGRIVSRAVAAVEPHLFGIGPVEAANDALGRAGIGWSDLAAVELNEAFAAQALACMASWPELDPALVNVRGGAIALGHPLGASGARILTSLLWQLKQNGGGFGLATACIGVGQGIAVVVESP